MAAVYGFRGFEVHNRRRSILFHNPEQLLQSLPLVLKMRDKSKTEDDIAGFNA
jgi:hypothetical protein